MLVALNPHRHLKYLKSAQGFSDSERICCEQQLTTKYQCDHNKQEIQNLALTQINFVTFGKTFIIHLFHMIDGCALSLTQGILRTENKRSPPVLLLISSVPGSAVFYSLWTHQTSRPAGVCLCPHDWHTAPSLHRCRESNMGDSHLSYHLSINPHPAMLVLTPSQATFLPLAFFMMQHCTCLI